MRYTPTFGHRAIGKCRVCRGRFAGWKRTPGPCILADAISAEASRPVNHNSGRVVDEVDPELKHALHAALAVDGLSLKSWFVRCAEQYIGEHRQPRLVFEEKPDRGVKE